jgi:hypothetical protein
MPERRIDQKHAFCACIARGMTPTAAARSVNIHRVTAYRWRREDGAFAELWDDAKEQLVEVAESQLFKAVEQGNLMAIMFLLKHRAADRYGTKVRVGGDPSTPPILVDSRPMIHRVMRVQIPDNGRDRPEPDDDEPRPAARVQPRRADTVHLPIPMPETVLEIIDPATGKTISMTADGHPVAAEDIDTVVAAIDAHNRSVGESDDDPDDRGFGT